jgi:hypothetical protein
MTADPVALQIVTRLFHSKASRNPLILLMRRKLHRKTGSKRAL